LKNDKEPSYLLGPANKKTCFLEETRRPNSVTLVAIS